MFQRLLLFQSDLKNYSNSDLLKIANHLDINCNKDIKYIINSIAMKQVLGHKIGNMELSDLPPELILNIVKDLDINDIGKLCTVSSQYSWICNESVTWRYIYKKELSDNNLPLDEYKSAVMEIYKIKENDKKYIKAAEKGYLKLLNKLDSQQKFTTEIRNKAITKAIENCNKLDILSYLIEKLPDNIYNNKYMYNHLNNSIKNKCFENAYWLIEKGIQVDEDILISAIISENLNFVKFIHNKGIPITQYVIPVAAGIGNLEILEWLMANGGVCDENIVYSASRSGHLNILEWALKNNCPFDYNAYSRAASGNQLNVIKWLKEKNIPWNEYLLINAAEKRNWDIFKWAISNRAPFSYGAMEWIMDEDNGNNLDIVKWIMQNIKLSDSQMKDMCSLSKYNKKIEKYFKDNNYCK